MTDSIVRPETVVVNLSPEGFQLWATQYYRQGQAATIPGAFSPVPFFLFSRAIELTLKARHVKRMTPTRARKFGQDLESSYRALRSVDRILTGKQLKVLRITNEVYMGKGFEYFRVSDSVRGSKRFPKLEELESLADLLVSSFTP